MMKRSFLYVIVLALMLGLLPLSNVMAQDEEITLTMSVWGSTQDQDVYTQRLEMVHELYPNITVELLYTPDDYSQRIQTMIAGGESPDIIQLAEDVHGYSQRGQLLGLNQYIEDAGIDLEARFGTLHNQYSWDGELYALPDRGGAMVLYYNVDMLDAAGIEYPTADCTWDDFLTAAQALTITDDDGQVT
jgi:multiple sugar transport system substrate-binding protein